jgi:ATP-grasp domain
MTQLDLSHTIRYDRQTPLGAVYDDQSVYIHLHRFFDDLVTISDTSSKWLKDLGLEAKNVALQVERPTDETFQRIRIASSAEFADYIKDEKKRKVLLYGPLSPPYVVNPLTYIMNSPTIAHAYEHKRYFRDEFSELINMPEYVVKRLDELDEAAFVELTTLFTKFVIQDVESSGSKGTFIISTKEHYDRAVKKLRETSFSGTVVVSQFIEGQTCSVQVCVTKYGIFAGGLQKQLVDSKHLCNLDLQGVTRWCGGELGVETPDIVKHRTQEIATVVGSELASHGYRGIFGIDLLVTPDNDVYAIEINARLTGYTHVLSDMQYASGTIPFSLLHTLELGNYKYEVDDLEALPTMGSTIQPFSYLILHNFVDGPFILESHIKSGIYEYDGSHLRYVKPGYSVTDLESEGQLLIFCKFSKGQSIERGRRVLKVIKPGTSMAEDGDLDEAHQQLFEVIRKEFDLPF